jgi:hypothetical protein
MKAVVCNSLSELFDAEPGAIFLEENGYLMCKCPRAAECDHSGVIQIPVHAPGRSLVIPRPQRSAPASFSARRLMTGKDAPGMVGCKTANGGNVNQKYKVHFGGNVFEIGLEKIL